MQTAQGRGLLFSSYIHLVETYSGQTANFWVLCLDKASLCKTGTWDKQNIQN